jgi:hypothetical protein
MNSLRCAIRASPDIAAIIPEISRSHIPSKKDIPETRRRRLVDTSLLDWR